MSVLSYQVLKASVAFVAAGAALYSVGSVRRQDPAGPIFGFSADSAMAERALEARFMRLPSAERAAADHKFLTAEPHVAGSPRDRLLAEWTRDRWRQDGLENVTVTEHEVLLPYAQEVTVEMTAPQPWRASLKEEPITGDDSSARTDVGVPYHAYSASGDVTAPVVYAASGNPADYDWLAEHGVDIKGKIALVRYSVPYSYRGFKALTAQKRGAAGILIYSDPAEDGYGKGKVYPDGPWGPESHIQRGGIVYDFMVPGDPLTPGWASVAGAPRIAATEAVSLPRIISVPLSYKDARVILQTLGGPEAPRTWQGGLPFTYHVGAGPAVVRMRVRMDEQVRPIWTVTGEIRGREEPDLKVVLGNHRDAWIFGGVDPSSGSASLMELTRSLGALAKDGWRPRRTIVFASWDAEEFTLTSSTEWGEQHEQDLAANAVAYLNVDSSTSGPDFTASAVPSLNRLILEAAQTVVDPERSVPIASAWRESHSRERGSLPSGAGDQMVNNRLGSGSDYTVFLNFIGVPVVDMAFDGPYGVYHSMYDNHQWVSRIGDPGFRYHVAMAKLWGVMGLRLANADVVPLDYRPYAAAIVGFIDEVERRGGVNDLATLLKPARESAAALVAAAERSSTRADQAMKDVSPARNRDALNRSLMAVERALLDRTGIPGRPWYRHQIYAPKFTYAPEPLPGVSEAIAAGDAAAIRHEVGKLAAALDRAAASLQK